MEFKGLVTTILALSSRTLRMTSSMIMREFSNVRKTFRELSLESPGSPRGMPTLPYSMLLLLIEEERIRSLSSNMRWVIQ